MSTASRVTTVFVEGTDRVVLRAPVAPPRLPGLTDAERDVALLLMEGRGADEIASVRGVSAATAANQVSSVLRKLRMRSRWQLLATAGGAVANGRGHLRRFLEGEWRVEDRFDRDDERFLIARVGGGAPLEAVEAAVVVEALAGQSTKEIAAALGLSPTVVTVHLTRATAKLGVDSRARLIFTFAFLVG